MAADVAGRVEFAPFFEGGGIFGVEAFEAEVQVGDGWGEADGEGFADCGVGHCFGFVVGAVEFAEGGEGGGEDGEVGVRADHVPGAFEDEGFGVGEGGEAGWGSWW